VSENLNLGDITKVDEKAISDIDLMTWGFPCTDISNAGKQKGFIDENGNITRSGLYYEGYRILKEKKPMYLIIENVKALTSKKFQKEFKMILKDLSDLGYNNYWEVLNAKDYGVPQNRERVFIVSVRKDIDNGMFRFAQGFDNGIRLKDILEDEVDDKYYLKQEKVEELIVKLHNKMTEIDILPKMIQKVGDRGTSNYSIKNMSNTIPANPISDRGQLLIEEANITGVYNQQDGFQQQDIGCTLDASYYKGLGNNQNRNAVLNIGNVNPSGKGMNGSVYSEEGLAPTVTTNKGEGSKILRIGNIYPSGGENGNIYNPEGLSLTLRSGQGITGNGIGSNNAPKIVEENNIKSCSLRTRSYINQPQQLEVRKDDISNTVTTVGKDSLIFVGGIKTGDMWFEDGKELGRNFPQGNRIYDSEGIACSQTAQGGGLGSYTGLYKVEENNSKQQFIENKYKEFIDENGYVPDMFNPYNKTEITDIAPTQTTQCGSTTSSAAILVKNATKQGYIEAEVGDSINIQFPDSNTRRGRVQKGVAGTLETACNQATLTSDFRIRKLTPKECWRLMGFDDEDINRCKQVGLSDTQLYKQAGNSIVVNVLEYIFKELFDINIKEEII
jgi:DNA-cytosine methyltransferase